jgi:hypothetical protein
MRRFGLDDDELARLLLNRNLVLDHRRGLQRRLADEAAQAQLETLAAALICPRSAALARRGYVSHGRITRFAPELGW